MLRLIKNPTVLKSVTGSSYKPGVLEADGWRAHTQKTAEISLFYMDNSQMDKKQNVPTGRGAG